MSPCHPVALTFYHLVTLVNCHSLTLSLSYLVTLSHHVINSPFILLPCHTFSPCQSRTLSTFHLDNLSPCQQHLVNLSPCQTSKLQNLSPCIPFTLSTSHLVYFSTCQPLTLSTSHLVTLSPCTLSPCFNLITLSAWHACSHMLSGTNCAFLHCVVVKIDELKFTSSSY